MLLRTYAIGGATIQTKFGDPVQAELVENHWTLLFGIRPVEIPVSKPTICLDFCAADDPPIYESQNEPICQSGALQGWQTANGYHLQCADATLTVDMVHSCAIGRLTANFWDCNLVEQREFFLIALLMLLRGHGYYGIHANGVVYCGQGVLLVGDSGAGKTTLTLSLVQSGWRYIGDDSLLLHQIKPEGSTAAVTAFPLRRGFACREETVNFFPQLATIAAQSPALLEGKKLLPIEAIAPGATDTVCTPRLLLFPKIVEGSESQLLPLDEASALTLLMRQSTGILRDRASAAAQIGVLKELVQQSLCYEFHGGTDVYKTPATVADRLSTLLSLLPSPVPSPGVAMREPFVVVA